MIIDRYRFNKRSDSKGPQINWVCVKKDRHCRATVTTFDNTILKYRNHHNHWVLTMEILVEGLCPAMDVIWLVMMNDRTLDEILAERKLNLTKKIRSFVMIESLRLGFFMREVFFLKLLRKWCTCVTEVSANIYGMVKFLYHMENEPTTPCSLIPLGDHLNQYALSAVNIAAEQTNHVLL